MNTAWNFLDQRLQRACFIAGLVCLLAIFICHTVILFNSYNVDENMYVSAATLLLQGHAMYGDFDFIQMPNVPVLYATMSYFFEPASPYTMAKLCTLFFYLGACWCLHGFALTQAKSRGLALLVVALFAVNPTVEYVFFSASNYALPIFAMFAAVYCLADSDKKGGSRNFFVCGLFAGIAIGAKLYYAPLLLPLFLIIAMEKGDVVKNMTGKTGPVFLGVIIGLLPTLYYVARYPYAFFFNNFEYHALSPQFHYQGCLQTWLQLCDDKLKTITMTYLMPANVFLLVVTGLGAYQMRRGMFHADRAASPVLLPRLAIGLVLVGAVAAAIPSPSHREYFAFPVGLFFIAFAVFVPALVRASPWWARGVACLALGLVLAGGGQLATLTDYSLRPGGTKMRIERIQAELEHLHAQYRGSGKTASMVPMIPVEAHLPYYRELSIGHFIILLGDWYNPEQKQGRITNREQLTALLESDPPDYVVAGLGGLDRTLKDFAWQHGYIPRGDAIYVNPALLERAGQAPIP